MCRNINFEEKYSPLQSTALYRGAPEIGTAGTAHLALSYPINVRQRVRQKVVEENLLQYLTMTGLHCTNNVNSTYMSGIFVHLRKPWRRKDAGI